MSLTLEQAFTNVDNVVANAAMTRKEHMALAESLQIIKTAAYPDESKKLEAPESVNGAVREDLKKAKEPEEDDGGTNGDTND